MIQSMTGYARAEASFQQRSLVWEIRSVNHRFLDLALHLPESCLALEAEIRARVARVVKRGRIEIWLRQPQSNPSESLRLQPVRLQELLALLQEVEDFRGGGQVSVSALELLRWPGVLVEKETPDIAEEQLLGLFEEALQQLVASRRQEGKAIADMLLGRIATMEEELERLQSLVPELESLLRQRLQERLGELAVAVDPSRWEQELVFALHRQDVAEELDRLAAHLGEIRQVLDRAEPVGRRLDFLVQECHREANTLGSKAGDLRLSQSVVTLKVLIEQLREQVQNVE